MKFFIIATRFLSAVASTSPNALRVRQDGPTAEVKDFTVDKLVRATDIEGEVSTTYTGISFIVDGPDASGVICETDNLHTFPTDILPCNNPKYHYVLSGGNQGSGIEFRIQVHFGDGSR
jgi:hypothetical protein